MTYKGECESHSPLPVTLCVTTGTLSVYSEWVGGPVWFQLLELGPRAEQLCVLQEAELQVHVLRDEHLHEVREALDGVHELRECEAVEFQEQLLREFVEGRTVRRPCARAPPVRCPSTSGPTVPQTGPIRPPSSLTVLSGPLPPLPVKDLGVGGCTLFPVPEDQRVVPWDGTWKIRRPLSPFVDVIRQSLHPHLCL